MEVLLGHVDRIFNNVTKKSMAVKVFILVEIGSLLQGIEATKCLRVESIGEREGNIYYCNDNDKDECCTEDGVPTCCEPQAFKTVREQLILWGSLSALLLLVLGLCCYFWKDFTCCKDDTPLSKKCCRCCKRQSEDDDDMTPIPNPNSVKSYAPQQWPSTSSTTWPPVYTNSQFEDDDGCESPAPPFQYSSTRNREKI